MPVKFGLKIRIIEFVDDSQPGFVNCNFRDVFGKEYTIFEKVPVVTSEFLDKNSNYPTDGTIGCIILDQNPDDKNPDIVKIRIDEPLRISSLDEETTFLVFKKQLTDCEID